MNLFTALYIVGLTLATFAIILQTYLIYSHLPTIAIIYGAIGGCLLAWCWIDIITELTLHIRRRLLWKKRN